MMSAADVLSRSAEQRAASSRALAVPRNSHATWKKNAAQASPKYLDASLQKMQDLSGIRPSHKQVEQHRRLKAKQYFDELRELLPGNRDSRCDRNRILMAAIECIKDLKGMDRGNLRQSLEMEEEREEDDASELMFDMQDVTFDNGNSKLSHNEVEQRRRLLAKKLFEELRRLLPESGKCDKNTILLNAISNIKVLQKEHVLSSSSPAPSSSSLLLSAPSSSLSPLLSASPADVTEAAAAFVQIVRGGEEEDEDEDEDEEEEEEGGEREDEGRRRKRNPFQSETDFNFALSSSAPFSSSSSSSALSASLPVGGGERRGEEEGGGDRKRRMLAGVLEGREERSVSLPSPPSLEEESRMFHALSLLSACASAERDRIHGAA